MRDDLILLTVTLEDGRGASFALHALEAIVEQPEGGAVVLLNNGHRLDVKEPREQLVNVVRQALDGRRHVSEISVECGAYVIPDEVLQGGRLRRLSLVTSSGEPVSRREVLERVAQHADDECV